MGRSKQGGVFGYLRGKVGSVSYSVATGKNSSTGKTQQIVRALPESVSNPQTAGQAMQRMKLAPAQKFYAAFAELLSNAFQGVGYGSESMRHFMSLAMSADGPYIQRGVDRFIPAAYPFSQGSLPSVGIEDFDGGAQVITLAATVAEGTAAITNEELATLLGVTSDYQITVAVVNNVNGVFVPSFIPYDQRLTIASLPVGTLGISDGHVTINPSVLGLDVSSLVACAVVLSVQDASGQWLRSTQEMVISNQLRNSLYSADALEAAIYSYQDSTTVNSINSEWYYNLGMSQPWPGQLIVTSLAVSEDEEFGTYHDTVVGLRQIDGRIKKTVFVTENTDNGQIILVENGAITHNEAATKGSFSGFNIGYTFEVWQDSYAAQLGVLGENSVTPSTTPRQAFWRSLPDGSSVQGKVLVNENGQVLTMFNEENPGYGYTRSTGAIGITEDGTDGPFFTDWADIIAEFGSEFIGGEYGGRGDTVITLPANTGLSATVYTYNGSNETFTPAVSDFTA